MTDKFPQIVAAFDAGSPMQRLLGNTLDRLGGMDFVQEWAEEYPSDFMRLLMAANPSVSGPPAGGNQVNVNIHPSLTPGPLDVVGEVLD